MDIIRDQVWQFIGAVIGMVTLAVSVVLYLRSRQRKELSYSIIYRTPIKAINGLLKTGLGIDLSGEPVVDAHLIEIKIENTGNLPIVAEDFVHPLKIRFRDDARVLAYESLLEIPETLDVETYVTDDEPNAVQVSPILLNKGWGFNVAVVLDCFSNIKVDGLIIGVSDIEQIAARYRTKEIVLMAAFFLAGMLVSALGSLLGKAIFGALPGFSDIDYIANGILAGAVGMASFLWLLHRRRKAGNLSVL